MAGAHVVVDMAEDDLLPAWATVIQLASDKDAPELTLVGGLMVAAHARRAGVEMRRPTDDVDALVDYAANRTSLAQANAALARAGFELSESEQHAYRFVSGDGRKVDLMVADHLPSRMQPRLSRRPAFVAPSGEQALRRRDVYELRFGSGQSVEIGVPDKLGALVAKGAAWLVDRRDRNRHLEDAAVLLASIADASALNYASMSKNDRKRVRAIDAELSDPAHPSWIGLVDADRRRAMTNLALIRQVLEA